jgi:hypothetical protein
MKGYTSDQMGDIFHGHWQHVKQYGKPVWYALDCSRFDAHGNRVAMRATHEVLAKLSARSGRASHLLEKLEWIRLEYVRKHGSVKYDPDHTVLCSGVPITSLYAIILVTAILYNHTADCVRFVDMGDDFGVIAPAGWDISGLLRDFEAVGQDVKLEGCTSVFEHIVFCQHHPTIVHRGNTCGARMIPGAKVVYGSLINLSPLPNDEYLAAVAVGHLHWARGSPFEAFFAGLLRMSGKSGSRHYARALGWNAKTMYEGLGEVVWDISSFELGLEEGLSTFLASLPEFTAPVVVGDSTIPCGAD